MNGFSRCCGGQKAQAPACGGGAAVRPQAPQGCGYAPVQTLPAQVAPAPRPCHHQVHGLHQGVVGDHQFDSISQVVEPAVECVQEFHHYAKVEHVIPVHVRNIHHQHTQHDYIIQQEATTNETLCYEYGLECEKDVCELIAQCGC